MRQPCAAPAGAVVSRARLTVLGEVTAVRGGVVAQLGSGKALALLALLAVDHRQVRADSAVLQALWSDGDAAHLKGALRVHASELRHRLSPVGIGLEWSGGGYRLAMHGGTVDIDEAREHAERADAAVRFRDVEHAARQYALALGRWTGEPFTGIDAPFVAPLRESLTYWHRSIRQNRLEADLSLGLGPLRLSETRELCALDPFDERACRHRIAALVQAGRRAEALEVYARFRRGLIESLGIEPGPELRAAQAVALGALRAAPSRPGRAAGALSRSALVATRSASRGGTPNLMRSARRSATAPSAIALRSASRAWGDMPWSWRPSKSPLLMRGFAMTSTATRVARPWRPERTSRTNVARPGSGGGIPATEPPPVAPRARRAPGRA